jgi:hypothetical protein
MNRRAFVVNAMNITEKHPTSQDHREGVLAKTIEKQTAKLSNSWVQIVRKTGDRPGKEHLRPAADPNCIPIGSVIAVDARLVGTITRPLRTR